MPLVIYLVIGSLFFGASMASKAKDCGEWPEFDPQVSIAVTIGWPMAISALLVDTEKLYKQTETKCEKTLDKP